MTLDEAIKHAEEVAEENEKSLREWKECINRGTVGWSDFDKEKVDTSITRCSKCAAEHRQLAEWLKELKQLREQEPCENANYNSINPELNGDKISRQSVCEIIDDIRDCISVEGYWAFLERLKKLPPVNPTKIGHWISVSERLPEEKQSVLVWCPQYKNIYCAYLEKEQWWIFGAFVQIVPNEVVAWMPLPKPYEPQERSGEK